MNTVQKPPVSAFPPQHDTAEAKPVPPKRRQKFTSESTAPPLDPAGAVPPDADGPVGHTVDWYAPASWSQLSPCGQHPLPDPFSSRKERLRRKLPGMSNSRWRRLQHLQQSKSSPLE